MCMHGRRSGSGAVLVYRVIIKKLALKEDESFGMHVQETQSKFRIRHSCTSLQERSQPVKSEEGGEFIGCHKSYVMLAWDHLILMLPCF